MSVRGEIRFSGHVKGGHEMSFEKSFNGRTEDRFSNTRETMDILEDAANKVRMHISFLEADFGEAWWCELDEEDRVEGSEGNHFVVENPTRIVRLAPGKWVPIDKWEDRWEEDMDLVDGDDFNILEFRFDGWSDENIETFIESILIDFNSQSGAPWGITTRTED